MLPRDGKSALLRPRAQQPAPRTRTGCHGHIRYPPAPQRHFPAQVVAHPLLVPHGHCTPPAAPAGTPPATTVGGIDRHPCSEPVLEVLVPHGSSPHRRQPVVERPLLHQRPRVDLPRPQDGVRQVHLRVLPPQHPSPSAQRRGGRTPAPSYLLMRQPQSSTVDGSAMLRSERSGSHAVQQGPPPALPERVGYLSSSSRTGRPAACALRARGPSSVHRSARRSCASAM
jgi:hypothetical protein